MNKRGSGTVQWKDGMWKVRVYDPRRNAKPKRPWIPLPGIPASDEALARRRGAIISATFRANPGIVPSERGETVKQWMERWFAWRRLRGISRVATAQQQYEKWFDGDVGHLPIAAVTKDHGKDIVSKLDAAVTKGEIEWKTAGNLWSIMSKAMKDAASCKEASLCVLDINPFAGVMPPDKGQRKQKQYLYPNELLSLLTCELVPLWRRRLYAFAIYSYMRAGELAAFKSDDILDMERGTVEVHQAVDRYGKRHAKREAKGTKTGVARRFQLESGILPLVQALLVELDDGALLFPKMPPVHGRDAMAPTFRADLLTAGVKRPSLHNKSKTRKPIGFHDLRATACTWAAVRGDSPLKIMARSGHETLEVLMQYVRAAEAVRDGFGDVFPPLPECLIGSVPEVSRESRKSHISRANMATPAGIESTSDTPRSATKSRDVSEKRGTEVSRRGETRGPETDLAEAVRLAATAGQWEVVSELSRQLSSMRVGDGPRLRVVKSS